MERILQSFKDLYKCEDVVKRHLWYAVLMILPGMFGSMRYFVDKDTPKEVLVIGLIAMLVVGLLTIVPILFTYGIWIDFIKDRLQGIKGIPRIDKDTFKKGLAYFPLTFVWGIYFGLIFVVLLFVPVIGIIASSSKHSDPLVFIGSMFMIMILVMIGIALVFVLAPFFNYVAVKYVKLGHYTADMFNPFILFAYMKKAFKSTMLVMFKMILASFIVNFFAGMVNGIIFVLLFGIGIVAAIVSGGSETAMYSPGVILVVIPLATLAGTIQGYTTGMVGFAAADNYLDVYKNEIEPYEE